MTVHKTPTGYAAKHPQTGRFVGHHATLGAALERVAPTPQPKRPTGAQAPTLAPPVTPAPPRKTK